MVFYSVSAFTVQCLSYLTNRSAYKSHAEFKYNWKADPTGPEAVVKVF